MGAELGGDVWDEGQQWEEPIDVNVQSDATPTRRSNLGCDAGGGVSISISISISVSVPTPALPSPSNTPSCISSCSTVSSHPW